MVEDTSNFTKHGTDVLGSVGDFNVEELLNSEGETLLVGHHGDVVEAVEVRKSLEVGLVLNQLLGTAMQQTDVRVGANNFLSIDFENQSQHTVSSRMLRTEVDGVVSDFAAFDRVLARLFLGAAARETVDVDRVGEVFVDLDEPRANGLSGCVFARACRRERSSGG